jgi:CsoR family transcriptional regulator, copper-sensing transcriptional repressor
MGAAMNDHDPKLISRLNRIEGQVRGISKMVAEGRYCIDILTQLQAVRAALAKVEANILQDHMGKCIEGAITGGDADDQRAKVQELIQLLDRSR